MVMCPTSLCDHWVNEIHRWTTLRASRIVNGKTLPDFDADVVVGSFDLIKNAKSWVHAAIVSKTWGTALCDECHGLKNKDSMRTKTLLPILRRAQRVILISGTPQLATPSELWTQMSVLVPRWMSWMAVES